MAPSLADKISFGAVEPGALDHPDLRDFAFDAGGYGTASRVYISDSRKVSLAFDPEKGRAGIAERGGAIRWYEVRTAEEALKKYLDETSPKPWERPAPLPPPPAVDDLVAQQVDRVLRKHCEPEAPQPRQPERPAPPQRRQPEKSAPPRPRRAERQRLEKKPLAHSVVMVVAVLPALATAAWAATPTGEAWLRETGRWNEPRFVWLILAAPALLHAAGEFLGRLARRKSTPEWAVRSLIAVVRSNAIIFVLGLGLELVTTPGTLAWRLAVFFTAGLGWSVAAVYGVMSE